MAYVYPARAKDAEFPRATALLVTEAINTNPNGDPSMQGQPRVIQVNGETYGVMSDVCIKRKLRDAIDRSTPAVLQAFKALNLDPKEHQILLKKFDKEESDDRAALSILTEMAQKEKEAARMRYYDVRMWGFMGIPKKEEKKGQKVQKDEQENLIYPGVVQFGIARTLAPVSMQHMQITRVIGTGKSNVGTDDEEDKAGAMGTRAYIDYGLYPTRISLNMSHVKANRVRRTDIELFRRILRDVYTDSSSSVRQLNTLRLYWYEHSNAFGDVPDWVLHDIWMPKLKPDRSGKDRDDYTFYDPEHPSEEAQARLKDNVKHIHDFSMNL